MIPPDPRCPSPSQSLRSLLVFELFRLPFGSPLGQRSCLHSCLTSHLHFGVRCGLSFRLLSSLFLGLLAAVSAMQLNAQEDDEDLPRYYPGVVAEFQDARGTRVRAVEDLVSRRFDGSDSRLAPGPLQATWSGRLFAAVPGKYQLRVRAAAGGKDGVPRDNAHGRLKIELNQKVILDQTLTAAATWLDSPTIDLPFGRHSLRVEYAGENSAHRPGAVAMYWEGPKFSLEPVGSQFLLHDRDAHVPDASRRGAELVRGLRCVACHQIPGEAEKLAAPDLRKVNKNVYPLWLRDWLLDDSDRREHDMRRMPQFVWNPGDVVDVVSALAAATPEHPALEDSKQARESRTAGKQLVHQTGCLACHTLNGVGGSGVYGGGDLSKIAAKRPAPFFRQWLREPAKLNADHRMPIFALTSKEQSQIASYLASLGRSEKEYETPPNASAKRGVQLLASRGCVQCHQVNGATATAPPGKSRLTEASNWAESCLGEPKKNRPGYRLSRQDAGAIQLYIEQLAMEPSTSLVRVVDGAQLMREQNCVACHQRNGASGLAPNLADIVEAHPEWASRLPAMKPPSLNSVGDKLTDSALREVIAKAPRRRDWLDVRMPKFRLDDQQLTSVIKHMVQQDRIPEGAPASSSAGEEDAPSAAKLAEQRVAGRRLVTADGFGCTSCHAVGSVKPSKAPINAAGPDLLMLGERIRKPWFDRWVRNPARIVPRMEMPSVQTPVRGLLHGHLDEQLDAVWMVLNTKGFVPPEPNPVRIVRRFNVAGELSRPAVVTDVLHMDKEVLVKPLLVGLLNRHNLLFDLETARIRGWWTGDTARQHTQGKTWLWRPGAPNLLADNHRGPELGLRPVGSETTLTPVQRGQFVTEFEWLEFVGSDLRFAYQLQFESVQDNLWVVETISPTPDGVSRRMDVSGPAGAELWLTPLGDLPSDREDRFVFKAPGGAVSVQTKNGRWVNDHIVTSLGDQGEAVVEMEFTAKIPADPFFRGELESEPRSPTELAVSPGFVATRLPFEMEMMPTAMTWRPDGQLIITSLKGRVWQATDANHDGLEDRAAQFADDLAAPFGVIAPRDPSLSGNSIDVVGKYALLRLTDADQDGWAERWERMASGWGHTQDYHDWTIGLPQDEQGRYYLATACQQDSRRQEAAKWRGVVLQLEPDSSALLQGGRRFPPLLAHPLTAGHRFPIGIARNRNGQLFVTDNQGNYNPFNELNHVQPGKRYGFINKLDRKPDFNPPLTEPSINIPHPWTRSVNGICFLETPESQETPMFGPYEGHLVGCEYDTRRLIRMSLEEVDGVMQGAAYPLTRDSETAEPLLGPLCAAISPRGELYVGCIRDSGWGGSNNVGSVVQLRPNVDALPPGIAEVRVTPDGFVIQLQGKQGDIDWERASNADLYSLSSYRRISTPAYGGNDVDRRTENVVVAADPERRQVRLRVASLRRGHVYELRVQSLTKNGGLFFPAEAHYTVHRAPSK